MHLARTDEFGLVVATNTINGELRLSVDRVDSLGGKEAEQAAARKGQQVYDDHYEVNDSPQLRSYAVSPRVVIWGAYSQDGDAVGRLSVGKWLTYLRTPTGRQSMFHLELAGGRVVAIEEQFFP